MWMSAAWAQVYRIADFCGFPIAADRERIDALLPRFSVAYMKAHKEQFHPVSVSWREGYEFIRKARNAHSLPSPTSRSLRDGTPTLPVVHSGLNAAAAAHGCWCVCDVAVYACMIVVVRVQA